LYYYILSQAIDTILSSCPDPIIEYSITMFGQKLNQVRGITHAKDVLTNDVFQWKMLLDKLLQLISQQHMADEHLSKIYPRLYKSMGQYKCTHWSLAFEIIFYILFGSSQ